MSDVNKTRVVSLSHDGAAITLTSEKVIFADQLRAVAFLCVVIVHWLGIYSLNSTFISSVTGAPAETVGNPSIYGFILPPLPHFNYGPFGVAIFFLISGFVIPFSFKNKSKSGFIFSRLLRIYPTYIACSFVMLAVTYASHIYWKSDVGITPLQFIANITLIAPIFNFKSIDFINWTLSIEIKFYLTCLLLYSSIKTGKTRWLLLTVAFIAVVIFLTKTIAIGSSKEGEFSFSVLKSEFIYIIYMMLGVLIHLLHTKKIGFIKFLSASAFVLLCFAYAWKVGPQNRQFINVGINYIYGYLLFVVAYSLRGCFRPFSAISFLSGVSYPFYALHSIIGYCIIRFVEHKTSSYAISLLSAFLFVLIVSYFAHTTVEKFSIKAGKKTL